MSTERIIHLADLSYILGSLQNVESGLQSVNNNVEWVGNEVAQTKSDLATLAQAFMEFVESDAKAKELALAETRQVKVRQELEQKFGHHGQIRRHATSILQATDVNLVRQETIRSVTEELMLHAPRYWLAPALVALSAWLSDNRSLAERALAEALRRDDEKTSLFMSLVCRRALRGEAANVWLDRYLGLQNPSSLERHTVVMLDATSNGVFSAEAVRICAQRVQSWLDELTQQPGFVDNQRQQWASALLIKRVNKPEGSSYPHLSSMATNWSAIEETLNASAIHTPILRHFTDVFDGAIQPAQSVVVAVDNLLTTLVTEFDADELPLREQEELFQLIINAAGDKADAKKRFEQRRDSLAPRVSFTQMLTNAAMNPELTHASRATQRFAIAHSRDWIQQAHRDITLAIHQAAPTKVDLQIEDWTGSSRDGANEKELELDLMKSIQRREDAALEANQITLATQLWAGFGVLLVLGSMVAGWLSALLGLGALGVAYMGYRTTQAKLTKIRAQFEGIRTQSAAALRACLAEWVEVRREVERRDAVSEPVQELLSSISPEQHLLTGHDTTRRVMVQTA